MQRGRLANVLEPESRHDTWGLRLAALAVLVVILGCICLVLFTLRPPREALLLLLLGVLGGWPAFGLGRRHARRDPAGAVTSSGLDRINM